MPSPSTPLSSGLVPMQVFGTEHSVEFGLLGDWGIEKAMPFCWVSVWNCPFSPGSFEFYILVCKPDTNSSSCVIKLLKLILTTGNVPAPTTSPQTTRIPVPWPPNCFSFYLKTVRDREISRKQGCSWRYFKNHFYTWQRHLGSEGRDTRHIPAASRYLPPRRTCPLTVPAPLWSSLLPRSAP